MLDTPHPSTAALALLDACTQAIRAQRAAHAEVVSAVAAVERADVHASCGHPSVARLLEELLRVDRGTARVLVAQSRLLVAPEPDPLHPDADVPEPDLPATADAAHDGAVDPDHVTVVATTMTRLRAVGGVDAPPLPGPVLAEVERQLAALARERSPRQLGEVAAEIADCYDPDGAAPHDAERPGEELRLSINRSGVCTGRFRFADPATGQALIDEITARTPPPDPDDQVTPLRPGPDLAERRGEALRHLLDDARHTRTDDENAGDPENIDCPDCDHHDRATTDTGDVNAADGNAGAASDAAGSNADARGDGSSDAPAVPDGLADLVDLADLDGRLDAALDDLLAHPTGSPPHGPHRGPASDPPDAPPSGPSSEPPYAADGRSDPGPGVGPGQTTGTGCAHGREPKPGPGTSSSRRDRPARDTTMIVTVPLELLEQRLQHSREHRGGEHRGGEQWGGELGLLDGRYRLTAETTRRLACDTGIVPAVLGSNGEILDLGRKTRTISTAQRRAVITRDRHCAFPGCRRSPKRCEVHHVIPWSQHGPTDLDHLVLLCTRHHQQIHHSPWAIHMTNSRPTFIPPAYLDPQRRPRTNADHRRPVAA